ncbi:hypothetical protein PVK06_023338 [Gossypium arboreum]|uniref:Uncharacterized protein n=1 Tax=Gossypium arboreum TaxID=29729 RepID=A0ABR0PB09_GOSAR|nr:hypothetical protein PVK06_023338 [Gossypium arboreum]
MTPTPLMNILTKNKLNENKSNGNQKLHIVLSCEKHKFVFDGACPPENQHQARVCRKDSNEITRCYIMTKEIMDNLEEMYEGQNTLARQSIITSLINSKQKSCTLALMVFFAEVEDNEVELDHNTRLKRCLSFCLRNLSILGLLTT